MPDLVPHPRAVTRRTAVGALALGSLAATPLAAGCDVDGVLPGTGVEPAGTAPTPDLDEAAEADAALVQDVVTALVAAVSLLTAARGRHRTLRPLLGPLAQAHHAHLAALDGTTEGATGGGVVGDPIAVLARVRAHEARLQRRLADAAVAAVSGELAQLLASTSASVAQHVTALPRTVPGGARG